jgi:hypothetical protein
MEAAKWIASQDLGILGGEVWIILGEGRWTGMIATAEGGEPHVWHWETTPERTESEVWSEFVSRGLAQAIGALSSGEPEHIVSWDVKPRLRYNLTYVSERDKPLH